MKSSTMVRGALAGLLVTGLVAAGCSSSDSDDEGSGSSSSSAEVVDLANFPSGPPDNIDPALTTELTGAQITTKAVKVDSKVTQTAARPAKAVQKPLPQDEPEPRVVKAAPQPAAAPAVRYRSFDDIAKDSP